MPEHTNHRRFPVSQSQTAEGFRCDMLCGGTEYSLRLTRLGGKMLGEDG